MAFQERLSGQLEGQEYVSRTSGGTPRVLQL